MDSFRATRETLRPSRSQTSGNHDAGKLLGHLLKSLVFDYTGAPGAQQPHPRAAPAARGASGLQIVPDVLPLQAFGLQQRHSLLAAAAGAIEIGRRSAGEREALPDVCAGQQAAVFRMAGERYGIPGKQLGGFMVARRVADLLVDGGILDDAL